MANTILVVDDVKMHREILKNILEQDGYLFLEASTGTEAEEILIKQYNQIKVVLLDLVMPNKSGFDVLRYIKSQPKLSNISIIVITGNDTSDSEDKAFELGANDYISKPFNPNIVKTRVRNALQFNKMRALSDSLQYDELSGLYNRDAFSEKATHLISLHDSGYYVLFDVCIAGLGLLREQYGKKATELLLQHFSSAINKYFGKVAGVCCHCADDEFFILCPTAYKSSEAVYDTFRNAASQSIIKQEIRLRIGIYPVTDKKLSIKEMFACAKLARDTVRGRYDINIAEYSDTLRQSVLYEQQICTDMNNALKDGQFEVWYQPQYDFQTGTVLGAEALARWNHREKGIISPALFLFAFERSGFIYSLDKFVWESVCKQLSSRILKANDALPVSINISGYDLLQPDFLDYLIGVTEEYRIPYRLLRLEISESVFSESDSDINKTIAELRKYGFPVIIDDFGTGYSSMKILRDIESDGIKLNISYLTGNDELHKGALIAESLINLCKALNISPIAKNVETESQANSLLSYGCKIMQGYYFAKPIPRHEYEILAYGNDD